MFGENKWKLTHADVGNQYNRLAAIYIMSAQVPARESYNMIITGVTYGESSDYVE